MKLFKYNEIVDTSLDGRIFYFPRFSTNIKGEVLESFIVKVRIEIIQSKYVDRGYTDCHVKLINSDNGSVIFSGTQIAQGKNVYWESSSPTRYEFFNTSEEAKGYYNFQIDNKIKSLEKFIKEYKSYKAL